MSRSCRRPLRSSNPGIATPIDIGNSPLPAQLSADQRSFVNAVRKLKLDVGDLVPMHGRPIPWAKVAALAGN